MPYWKQSASSQDAPKVSTDCLVNRLVQSIADSPELRQIFPWDVCKAGYAMLLQPFTL